MALVCAPGVVVGVVHRACAAGRHAPLRAQWCVCVLDGAPCAHVRVFVRVLVPRCGVVLVCVC